MSTKRFRLTKAAKILIVMFIIILLGGGVFVGVKTGFIKTNSKSDNNEETKTPDNTVSTPTPTKEDKPNNVKDNNTTVKNDENDSAQEDQKNDLNVINLSIDEWVGYATIIQANGGLQTQPGSIYDKLGIKVNISIINDATQSSNALIKGSLDGAGYTINRLAFLSSKFSNAKVDVVMPYITNYSNGGDGIIALSSIRTIEDLVNAKIGVPQFSESQAMIVWFVNQSDLPQSDKDKIINNLILFETADETAKAFFAGKIDVAGTWQPYLTQAENMTDSHIMFSTASSTKLIMSGIIFRDDFAKKNPELVSKFIDGTLQAVNSYDKELEVLRKSMPMFSGMSDEDIVSMTYDADLTTWQDNMRILKEDAGIIYNSMCDVWTSLGEATDKSNVDKLFDVSYMESLRNKYETLVTDKDSDKEDKVVITEENKQNILETTALLTKSASVNFIINTAKFVDTAEASKVLNEFIDVAKLLDGTIIQIEGNTDPNPNTDPTDEANILLSKQRAETVKQYFIANGISADRIIVVGNGSSKPIVENDTAEHRAMNRRTDVSFKIIE